MAQLHQTSDLLAPTLVQGLTVGRVLRVDWLCCVGHAGGWQRWHTRAIGVPGLPAVVAELSATALAPAGEAGTLSTAVGNDSVAVGRKQSVQGDQQCPLCTPAQHAAIPLPSTARPCRGRSQLYTETELQPLLRRARTHCDQLRLQQSFPIQHPHSSSGVSWADPAWPRAPTLAQTQLPASCRWDRNWDISLSKPNPTQDCQERTEPEKNSQDTSLL